MKKKPFVLLLILTLSASLLPIHTAFASGNNAYTASTTTKDNGNIFTVTPSGVEKGNTIFFACYQGNRLIYSDARIYNNESTVNFTFKGLYENAKVFVWDNTQSIVPKTSAEKVVKKIPDISGDVTIW